MALTPIQVPPQDLPDYPVSYSEAFIGFSRGSVAHTNAQLVML